MGRKIPGKKHKGVKDPEKQHAVRLKSLKDKINQAPKNPDEQAVPKSLQKLINFKKKLSAGEISLKVKKRKKSSRSLVTSEPKVTVIKPPKKSAKRIANLSSNPVKPPASFSQLPGESTKTFLCRVNQTVQDYLKESKFENKFGVNVKRSEQTGEITGVEKRPKDELEELLKQARQGKGKKKKKKSGDGESKLSKTQKKNKKISDKREKRELDKIDDFDKYKDDVKFGEVVHGPPTLHAPRKVSKTNEAPRPGRKELLLKKTLITAPNSSPKMPVSKITVFQKVGSENKVIDKKGKRKDLPTALRRQIEANQSEVMQAYKRLKAERKALD